MIEYPKVCQSQNCMYRAHPAVDVWTNNRGNTIYLCAECSIALGPRLKRNYYTWSQLPPQDHPEATIIKEYAP